MAQDYRLQYVMVSRLKGLIDLFFKEINNFDNAYKNMIELSYQYGLPEEMYKTMAERKERVHAILRNLSDKIGNEDLVWIKSVEDCYDAVLSVSGNASVSDTTVSSGSTLGSGESGDSANLTKAEIFKRGTQKVESLMRERKAAIAAAASDTGKEENQRNIHADYLAAFIANQKQH